MVQTDLFQGTLQEEYYIPSPTDASTVKVRERLGGREREREREIKREKEEESTHQERIKQQACEAPAN